MKLGKIVAALLACLLALGLLACKKTDDPVIDIGGSASPNQTDAPATQQGSVADSATPNSGLSTSVPTSEGTSDINPTPTEAPDNESIVSLGSETAPARNTMPTETYGLSNTECESWFSDAVFIGDSITIGWKNYNNRMLEKNPEFFGNTRFLCEGSYGVGHALEPISDSSLHPVYGGEQCYIWDAVYELFRPTLCNIISVHTQKDAPRVLLSEKISWRKNNETHCILCTLCRSCSCYAPFHRLQRQ